MRLTAGVDRNGNRRHAVILWRNGDLFGAVNRPHNHPERTAAEYMRQSVPLDCANDGWRDGAPLLYMEEIRTTPAELRSLVKQAEEAENNRRKARAYPAAKGR